MNNCTHTKIHFVMIGYSRKAGSLMYKLGVCLECRKYLDTLGGLKAYEAKVLKLLNRPWKWTDDAMPQEEFANWDYSNNVRLIFKETEPYSKRAPLSDEERKRVHARLQADSLKPSPMAKLMAENLNRNVLKSWPDPGTP